MKIRLFSVFLLSLLLALTTLAGPRPKLRKTSITSHLSMGVPDKFMPLSLDAIAAKFPAAHKPLAVFSDPSGRADLSVAQKSTPFTSQDYALLLKIYKASIQNMYTKVEFISEDIRTVNKRDYVVLEFVSTLADTRRNGTLAPIRRYQLVQYAIEGNQLLVFTFTAPGQEQPNWQATAQAAMQSIVLK